MLMTLEITGLITFIAIAIEMGTVASVDRTYLLR